jgi:hypothetical protein
MKPCPRCGDPVEDRATRCPFCSAPIPVAPRPPVNITFSGAAVRNAVIAILAILVIVWFTGSLDRPLSSVGLNKNPCVQNAFGATFCGDDAERLCEQFGGSACAELGYPEKGQIERELEDAIDDPP